VSRKTKSKTERDTTLAERIFNWKPHFKTTIWDDKDRIEYHSNDADDGQKRASEKWRKLKEK